MTGMIKTDRVAQVMSAVDRAEFCQLEPYADAPSPIGFNATISAPHMHAFALEQSLAALRDGARVLDVGSGSGYLSVCYGLLASPGGLVVGLEHIEGLVELAVRSTRRAHADLLDSGVLRYVVGDGREGYAQEAPYDVIHVGAASERVPRALLDQLAPNGVMIIPVGEYFQSLRVITKDAAGAVAQREEIPVRYVPLTDKAAQLRGGPFLYF